jgi:hypothetical protein
MATSKMRQNRGRVNAKNEVFSLLYPLNWGCTPKIYLFTFIVNSVNNLRKRPHEYMQFNIETTAGAGYKLRIGS